MAKRMGDLHFAESVRINTPVKSAELRIRGLDESIRPADVIDALVAETGCTRAEVKAGVVQQMGRGMGTLWVQYSLTAARKLAAEGWLRVGWVAAKMNVLPRRAVQCPLPQKGTCSGQMPEHKGQEWEVLPLWQVGPQGQRMHCPFKLHPLRRKRQSRGPPTWQQGVCPPDKRRAQAQSEDDGHSKPNRRWG